MCQADVTKHLLSLDHPGAQKHEQGRRAISLLNSEKKTCTNKKAPRSSMKLIKGQGQMASYSYEFSS